MQKTRRFENTIANIISIVGIILTVLVGLATMGLALFFGAWGSFQVYSIPAITIIIGAIAMVCVFTFVRAFAEAIELLYQIKKEKLKGLGR